MALVKKGERTVKCRRCGMRGRSGTSEALYWYVDDTKCENEKGYFQLLHEDMTPHTERCTGKSFVPRRHIDPRALLTPQDLPRDVIHYGEGEDEYRQGAPKVQPVSKESTDLIQVLRDAIGAVNVDREQVRTLVDEEVKSAGEALREQVEEIGRKIAAIETPTLVEILDRRTFETRVIEGAVHKAFPKVLKYVQTGVNVWLFGPAGTGKTTIARMIAEAMGIDFGYVGLTATKPLTEITGYRDAVGTYQTTAFRRVYEHGGVFLFDECDNANPNTLGAVNSAIDNGGMEFPDGMVKKHSETFIIAAANTNGTGANRQYVGRMQLDAAFLDRFVHVEIGIDEALESQVAHANCSNSVLVEALLTVVRRCRRNADDLRLAMVVASPRASRDGAKLLEAGATLDEVVQSCIRKGLSDKDWLAVSMGI